MMQLFSESGSLSCQARRILLLKLNARFCTSVKSSHKWYRQLGIPEGSDQETVRKAYLELAKKYHPDSGTSTACADKFQEVENAYKNLLREFSKQRWNVGEGEGEYGLHYEEPQEKEQDFGIEHTVPQHRQYLNYGGVGSGTPFQRERQFNTLRTAKAVSSANQYRINKIGNDSEGALVKKEERKKAKKIKTGLGIDRLIEDKIQESMSRGEFKNLKGSGKPLPYNAERENPYVDFITHKMNQVLIDNGFTPAWITIHKEIRDQIEDIRNQLAGLRAKVGEIPLGEEDSEFWKKSVHFISAQVKALNEKIDNFNLLVPMLNKQMFHFNLEHEAEKVLREGVPFKPTDVPKEVVKDISKSEMKPEGRTFIKQVLSLWNKR